MADDYVPEFAYIGAPGIQALADAIRDGDMSWIALGDLENAVRDFDELLTIRDQRRNRFEEDDRG